VQIGPLLIVTVIFWRACRPVFHKPMSVLSLRTAVDMDHNDTLDAGEVPLGEQEDSADPERKVTYLQPAMDFHQRRHDSVMKEAEEMDLVLDGKKVPPPHLPTMLQKIQYTRLQAECLGFQFQFHAPLTAILPLKIAICMGNNSCVADVALRLMAILRLMALRLKACILY